jgi:hypothetical protein
MDRDKPISGELAALMPVISQTMQFAVQSVRQSTALASVLIRKGILTQAELDKAVAATDDPAKILQKILAGLDQKSD